MCRDSGAVEALVEVLRAPLLRRRHGRGDGGSGGSGGDGADVVTGDDPDATDEDAHAISGGGDDDADSADDEAEDDGERAELAVKVCWALAAIVNPDDAACQDR